MLDLIRQIEVKTKTVMQMARRYRPVCPWERHPGGVGFTQRAEFRNFVPDPWRFPARVHQARFPSGTLAGRVLLAVLVPGGDLPVVPMLRLQRLAAVANGDRLA